MAARDADEEELIERARAGNGTAADALLARHRARLRQMIAVRLDTRLAARLDPSDVVQEVLVDASRKLPEYLRLRPLPFYPWLRQIAWERVVKLHQRHLYAQKRTALREEQAMRLPDHSALELASRLVAPGASPSRQLMREETRRRVQAALAQLAERDREILVMRYLEQLSTPEIAAVLEISAGAVRTRHVRALARIRDLLGDEWKETDE